MAQQGIVGFFDILGYQNIINNNEIEHVSNIISDIILKLPEKTHNLVSNIFKNSTFGTNETEIKTFLDSKISKIEYLIISDSILITLPVDLTDYEDYKPVYWIIFLFYSCVLLDSSFHFGLPLRGAVEYGEFITLKNCFAGKSIIDAYNIAQQLEFSGCVVGLGAQKIILELRSKDARGYNLIKSFLLNYLAPLKNKEQKLYILNWVAPASKNEITDVRQYVIEAFHAHNKDIPVSALNKVTNTENLIRFCLSKNKDHQSS